LKRQKQNKLPEEHSDEFNSIFEALNEDYLQGDEIAPTQNEIVEEIIKCRSQDTTQSIIYPGHLTLDDWQKEILTASGNLCINCGRQVGKSTIVSIKASEYIIHNPKKSVLIISVTEDQAEMMIQKILLYLYDNYKPFVSRGNKRPTKHQIQLNNGSSVKCKAVGQAGIGVLGLTIDILIADEAAYMPEAIWQSVTPMLLTTGGSIWLISTPNAQEGYFYETYTNPSMHFKTFHINSEEVAKLRPEPQSSIMLEYLRREKARMTELQYAQQYLAQFLEELQQLFPDSLINSCQTEERTNKAEPNAEYYLGVDVARMGADETTFEVLERLQDGTLIQRDNQIHVKQLTTVTTDQILALDCAYDFRRIFIDDGGLGVAVFDALLAHPQTSSKVVAINNASRSITRDDKRRKKLLKEDLYMNLKNLMERGQIKLLKDNEIFASLKSLVVESNEVTHDMRIYGRYTHIAEGLIRAAWCNAHRSLNIYLY
jgi:hypothetical protein